jgi:VanZ family protein
MRKKFIAIIIHPLFIYFVIAFLECIPYNADSKRVVLHEMPEVGDNFREEGGEAVFYYSGKGKFGYPNIECYYSYGNPTFDVDYKKGGVKTIEKSIAEQIPLLGSMCEQEQMKVEVETPKSPLNQYLTINYVLFTFSNISHVLFYILLACSTIFHFRTSEYKYWFGFAACFLGGALLELIQHLFVYGRSASWEDQALNTIGATVGILLYAILGRTKLLRN